MSSGKCVSDQRTDVNWYAPILYLLKLVAFKYKLMSQHFVWFFSWHFAVFLMWNFNCCQNLSWNQVINYLGFYRYRWNLLIKVANQWFNLKKKSPSSNWHIWLFIDLSHLVKFIFPFCVFLVVCLLTARVNCHQGDKKGRQMDLSFDIYVSQ